MQRVLCTLVAFLLVFLAAAAPAGAIIGGIRDEGTHPFVGVFEGNGVCSGALISPTVLLTAGHCTVDIERVSVSFLPEIYDLEGEVDGTAYTHPNFCVECAPGLPGTAMYDVGVIILDEPVYVDWYATLPYAGQVNDLGKRAQLTAVGYGAQGFQRGEGPPLAVGIGIRNYGPTTFINDNHRLADMFLKHSGNAGQGGVCAGDSGGPILSGDTVLAVISFNNWNCNSSSYAQRVDIPEVQDWIHSFL